jgi:hypothetical protein
MGDRGNSQVTKGAYKLKLSATFQGSNQGVSYGILDL